MPTENDIVLLDAQRAALAANLTTQGVTAVGTEALSALVPKVLDIATESTLTGDAVVANVLDAKTFYSNDPLTQLTGTMANNGANNVEVTDVDGTLIPVGYYNGSGSAVLSATEQAKVIAGNIKDGVTLLGVLGTLSGASVLTGDAIAAEVLTGKKFYSDDPATQLTGTMPNNSGNVNAVSYHADGTSLHIVPAQGYTDGSDDATVITDANHVPEHIKAGITDFGVEGTYAIELTGDAAVSDVKSGKTFYNTDTGTKETGTYVPPSDDDAYTVSMLHFDGDNGGTTFTDAQGKTWTGTGTAQTSSAQKAYGTTSLLLDGNSDYISTPDSDDFAFGTGDFTIDFWFWPLEVNRNRHTIFSQYQDANNYIVVSLVTTNIQMLAYVDSSPVASWVMSTAQLSWADRWCHVAIARSGGVPKLFVNGIDQAWAKTGSGVLPNLTGDIIIGARNIGGTIDRYAYGYIDEFRVSKGIARWTANFAPGRAYVV